VATKEASVRHLPSMIRTARRMGGIFVVLVAAVLVVSGCAAGVPTEAPGITGTVVAVTQAGDGASILVTGSGQVDKAAILVDARTTLLRQAAGGTSAAFTTDIKVGSHVRVWFDGPVAESYPVQGHAGTVLLLKP
jgi:hypothetical protein